MSNENKKGFHPVYLLAICYTLLVYSLPVLFFLTMNSDDISLLLWSVGILLLFGLCNFYVVIRYKERIGRLRLLHCTILIKYALIPFYFMGGLIIAISILLMFTPIVIMMFAGPMIALILSTIGWFALLGAAPFSIAYLVMSHKEGKHGKLLTVLGSIFQFCFGLDVITIILLSLKEKRCVKLTTGMIIILILGVLITLSWLIVKIMGAII